MLQLTLIKLTSSKVLQIFLPLVLMCKYRERDKALLVRQF